MSDPYQQSFGEPTAPQQPPADPVRAAYKQQPAQPTASQPAYQQPAGQQSYQPAYQQPAPTPDMTQNVRWNAFALAGFVCAICSIFIFGWLLGIVGLVLSIVGFRQIKHNGGKGKGLSIAGIAVSAVVLAIYLIILLLGFSILGGVAGDMLNNIDYSDLENGFHYSYEWSTALSDSMHHMPMIGA